MQSRFMLLLLNGAILTACAVFIDTERKLLLIALMLFLPLLDKYRRDISITLNKQCVIRWLSLTGLIALLLLVTPAYQSTPQLINLLTIVLLTALPEEWFFRRYVQSTLLTYFSRKKSIKLLPANVLSIIFTSVFFATLHIPVQGYIGLAVFIPSVILGYIYQLKQDLIFVILLHSLFNLIFIIYIREIYTGLL